MRKEQTHMNRMWWMASAAVLLFVALAVAPVAAAGNDWSENALIPGVSYYNYTRIPTANEVRFPTFPNMETGRVNLTMINGTGGMNAVHISNNPAVPAGQCNPIQGSTEGTFYITDTGGRGYQDNVILLIGVASDDNSDRMNSQIDIDAAGYIWTPHDVVNEGPDPGEPVLTTTDVTIDSSNYATDGEGGVYQNWKFAPNPNYPWYCGQDMSDTSAANLFNWTAVDLHMGLVPNTSLTNNGMVRVDYTLSNENGFNSADTKVAFNMYAYNWYAGPSGVPTRNVTLWLNRVNTSSDGASSSYSGWVVYPGA